MPLCDRCDRFLRSWDAYHRHVADSPNHHLCDECGIDFPTWVDLKQHWVQDSRHNYCRHCDEHFADNEDLEDHYSHAHELCSTCNKVFKNPFSLKAHYRQSSVHHYCVDCDKLFTSANNLTMHLNSSIHRPKDIVCPTRCGAKFVSRSALVLHLENGACSSGIDRNTVNRVVRAYDRKGIITDPSRLIGGGHGTNAQEVTYIATDASWNGCGYQCYLCANVHRSLHALNQHLASPRHQEEIYICRGPACGQRFRVLSALVAHIESEKCGISKFKYVQATMNSVLGQVARLTYT